jgi:catechol 2,3-dioxygenase-like lactoylglutathione lyase family enzyme
LDIQPTRFFHINVNVTDMDRSMAFYEKLGFQTQLDAEVEDPVVALGLGLPAFKVRAVFMQFPGAPSDSPLLDLVQFRDPAPDGEPYAALNHVGIGRFALGVDDLDEACRTLDKLGIEYIDGSRRIEFAGGSDWSHGRPTGFITLRDPDGTFIQLTQARRIEPAGAPE